MTDGAFQIDWFLSLKLIDFRPLMYIVDKLNIEQLSETNETMIPETNAFNSTEEIKSKLTIHFRLSQPIAYDEMKKERETNLVVNEKINFKIDLNYNGTHTHTHAERTKKNSE